MQTWHKRNKTPVALFFFFLILLCSAFVTDIKAQIEDSNKTVLFVVLNSTHNNPIYVININDNVEDSMTNFSSNISVIFLNEI